MRKLSIFAFLLMIHFNCATQKEIVTDEIEEKTGETEEVTIDIEPLSMLKDDVILTPPKWEIKKIDYNALLTSEFRQIDSLKISLDEMTSGFRVQVGSFREIAHAIEFFEEASSTVEEEVYLGFDQPFHKVRVGDCSSRKNAHTLLDKVRRNGFSDALIIPTRVYKYPELRRQEEENRKKAEADTLNVDELLKKELQEGSIKNR